MNTSLGWVGNRIGLTSHWPYVTDISGLSTYGLDGPRQGNEHPAYAPSEYSLLYLYYECKQNIKSSVCEWCRLRMPSDSNVTGTKRFKMSSFSGFTFIL